MTPYRLLHMLFAAISAVVLVALALAAWQWREARAGNAGLAAAAAAEQPPERAEARLAWAATAARRGAFDAAVRVYKDLAQQTRGALQHTALYNLGTLYLEQARRSQGTPGEALPLVELAKQPLRELLRQRPDDWPARHQLEWALRQAPEADDLPAASDGPEVPKERAASTGPAVRIELP